MSQDRDRDYVGYCHPPKEHQFKKGQGRTGARRTKPKNPLLLLQGVLNEKVSVKIGGEPQKMTRQRALLCAFRQKILEGDRRAIKLWAELMAQENATGEPVDYSKSIPRFLEALDARMNQLPLEGDGTPALTPEEIRGRQREQQDQLKREALGGWYKPDE